MVNMQQGLTKQLTKIRAKELLRIWEEYKSFLTMTDIARMFNMPLATFYKIIKRERTNLLNNQKAK